MTVELSPRIVVFGVGGAGGNAVDNMVELELQGVEFVVANTDAQALSRSKASVKIQLGPETTKGLGAGARPEVGAEAAEESRDEVRTLLDGANMVFIAAGMGGGTGTGAAPIIAQVARELGILTVGVVTKPFGFEHARRMNIAEAGIKELRPHVDTLIVVPNQNLFRVANERTPFSEAFRMVDDVLYSGVRGITDLMVMPGLINLDFADVHAVMSGMGTAMMGIGEAEGENRALNAARSAIDNPLLDDVSMKGARGVLINITGGYDMTLYELDEAANEIRAEVASDANVIVGSNFDDALEGKIRISVVAAGLGQAASAETASNDSAPVAKPPSDSEFDGPVVITPAHLSADVLQDSRPDFEGRALPSAHIDAVEGEDKVSAELALGVDDFADAVAAEHAVNDIPATGEAVPLDVEPAPEPPVAEPDDTEISKSPSSSGLGGLFGWGNRGAEAVEEIDKTASQSELVEAMDEHPEPAPFDDADLEIPAFLRRSANH